MDDLIMEEYPGVKEALKRLPPQEIYDREFRLKIAIDLSAKHQLLPKNLWTTDETVCLE
jgi:ubiquinol-cytochrome c reductase subunit 7